MVSLERSLLLGGQNNNSFPIHERLKADHFHLTPSSRMRNGMAEDVLDKRMLFLMQVRKVKWTVYKLQLELQNSAFQIR